MPRGERLAQAIKGRGIAKMMNLAVDLDVDESAISRWKKGGAMSLEHAARLSLVLDVSLDWLVLGRGGMSIHKKMALSADELKLIRVLRRLDADSVRHLVTFLEDLPGRR